MVELAQLSDLDELDRLALDVIEHMATSKIPQWTKAYPRRKHFENDIMNKGLYLIRNHNQILGCMALFEENDPPYKTISSWQKEYSIVMHRILVSPQSEKQGIASQLLEYAIEYGVHNGYESIKIDTHLENYKMRNFLEKNGFVAGDYIEVIDRIAYEKILEVHHE
jgi:GNAT superfamily N-acetyltransferase